MPQNLLARAVLVVDRHWRPVQTTDAAGALCLLYAGRAWAANHTDPVDYGTYDWESWGVLSDLIAAAERDSGQRRAHWVRTCARAWLCPEVVVLPTADRGRQRRAGCNRAGVLARDRHRCQYCGTCPGVAALTLDHVLPRSRGGKTGWENLVSCCVACNTLKADRTPEEAGLRLLSRPVRPAWNPIGNLRPLASWRRFLE